MARTAATLGKSTRIADLISLSVIAKTFPLSKVRAVLEATGKTSIRERNLPAHVVVYYVIALSIYMMCCGACWKASGGCSTRRRRSK